MSVINWTKMAAEQRRWIDAHGGNLAAYVTRYGSKDDPEHYGDGGEAIYAADFSELKWREFQADAVRRLR